MSLAAGAHVGPYEIVALVGAGGMGEVYRARDPRLGRDVAIKVLPAHLSANPETRARFEREARAISQLSHPHICTLYDIGSTSSPQAAGGATVDYLVMEYLEGETLAARLEKGPLPLADVTRYGIEIASALDRAHRSGIIHRDLKPANVMLTKAGVKLMDFGLARPTLLTPGAVAPTDSPTVSRPLTGEGTIVGTLQYMAPEQLEGKEADARTDLWALGCVLYEMASGTRAFAGTSQASLIAAILKEAPRPLPDLQPLTPPALERVVRQCLQKDPDERWQSAHDIASELGWISSTDAGPVPSASQARPVGRWRERLAWVVAGVMGIAAVAIGAFALVALRWAFEPPAATLMRFSVTVAPGGTVVTDATSAAVSPDGRRLVLTATDSAGIPRLWIRSLDALAAQPLLGTENAILPFWSPDSRFVAFFAQGKLQRVSIAGGSPEVICDAPLGRGGAWGKNGAIVFAPLPMGPLLRVSADGGEAVEVARPDATRHETALRFPSFLPDGNHFLYVSLPRKQEGFDVYVGALDAKQSKRVMSAGSSPIYAEPGYLLFVRGGRVVAQRFDAKRLEPRGDILPLGDVAPVSADEGAPLLSASANGVLVHTATTLPSTRLVWLDRAGRTLETIPLPPDSYASPCLSPDDRRAIVTKANSPTSYDLWLVDLERAIPTRLTFDGLVASGGGLGSTVVWSPDGSRVAYQCSRSGTSGVFDVCQVPTTATGAGRPESLVQSDANVIFKAAVAWSPDGKYLVFSQVDERTQWDLWLLPQQGERKPVPYLRTPFNETSGSVSPDGRWLAYDSDEAGRSEIYVQSFPEPREKTRVSTAGGTGAQWSRDGKQLLIWGSGQLVSTFGPVYVADVQTTPTFKTTSAPRVLFTPRQDLTGLTAASDLKRFLATVPVEGATPPSVTVMVNWQAALKGR